MKILYQINYVGGVGADRWIASGWKDAFEALGHNFFYFSFADDLMAKVNTVKPDIIFTLPSPAIFDSENQEFLRSIRKNGVKVFTWVDNLFYDDPNKLDAYRNGDIADVYWGENEAEWMRDFVRETGRNYVTIPLAANLRYHFPTDHVKKYMCDIVFLGAKMPYKKDVLKKLLLPLKKAYDVKIYGPNWTAKDNLLRLAGLAVRRIGFYGLNGWIQKLRITVPPEEENQLYSSAKICLNIHERGPEQKNHIFLNERGFKIPACGGFEICDYNLALRRYFGEKEVVMAKDEEWFEKIDYYLKHGDERLKIKEAGTRRALEDHTYNKRVKYALKLVNLD